MRRIKEGTLVEVEWSDATSYRGWHLRKDARKLTPDTIRSAGYWLGDNKHFIRLERSRTYTGSDDAAGDILVIPAPWVVKVRRVS